jgi:hypothetical protein
VSGDEPSERAYRAAEEILRYAHDARYPDTLKLWMAATRVQQEIDKEHEP